MRKHLYLITEHQDDNRVGDVSVLDSRLSRGQKNVETPIHTFDKETGDFNQVGKHVSMGYVDFDSLDDYEDRIGDAIKEKLAEIDQEHREKAGVDHVGVPA